MAGLIVLLLIALLRFGKYLKPRQAENIFEVLVETVDDMGKIKTISSGFSTTVDSLAFEKLSQCLNNFNFFSKSYPLKLENCYSEALNKANKNDPKFAEILIKLKTSLDEILDNHYFFIGIDTLLLESKYVDFDSEWVVHFSKPSTIDMKYKQVLFNVYESKSETRKLLDSTDERFKELEKIMAKEN